MSDGRAATLAAMGFVAKNSGRASDTSRPFDVDCGRANVLA